MERFIPEFIVNNFNHGAFTGNTKAITMFVDISGFTQTTESLSKFGKEGSEILSDILHFLFEKPTEEIHKANGFISNFIGDAFISFFTIDDKNNIDNTVKKILTASFNIKKHFEEHGNYKTKHGVFSFGLKIGLGYGNINWEIIGTDKSKTYYFNGQSLKNAIGAENKAERNNIIAHSSFGKISQKYIRSKRINNDFLQIISIRNFKKELNLKSAIHKKYSNEIDTVFVGKDALKIRDGEFRNVISVYVSFRSAAKNMSGFYSALIDLSIKTGGSKPQLFLSDKGWNVLVFFGAPKSFGNNRRRSLEFILALKNSNKVIIPFKAGITEGTLYAGYTGSNLRKEFTCFGVSLNLAARMMSKAKYGRILVDKKLSDTGIFKFSTCKSYFYKGFKNKIKTFEFYGKNINKFSKNQQFIIGRDKESTQIKNFLKELEKGSYANALYLSGKEGIGKTVLLEKVRTETYNELNWLHFPSSNIMQESLKSLISFLKDFFKIKDELSLEQQKDNFENNYSELLKTFNDKIIIDELNNGKDFIAMQLDLLKRNRTISENEGKNILENTYFAVKSLIKAISLKKPVALLFDDAQWIDEDTKNFLSYLKRNIDNYPIAIIFSLRPDDKGNIPNLLNEDIPKIIKLENLSIDYSEEMIAHILNTNKNNIPYELAQLIIKRSHGNPFYVEQFCYYLKENSLLNNDLKLNKKEIELPSRISSIITARIDRFSKSIKEMIETASVLGNKINIRILSEILNGKELSENFKKIEEEDIWYPIDQLIYLFKHILIRETAYNMLLKKKLRNLHFLAGSSIEKIYSKNIKQHSNILAEHFLKAEKYDIAYKYLKITIKRAKDKYLFSEVEKHNQTILKILPLLPFSEKKKYKIKTNSLASLEYNFFLSDKFDEEYKIINRMLDLARKEKDKELLTETYLNIYKVESTKGHAAKALKYSKKALKIAKENNYTKIIPFAYYSTGKVYVQMGKRKLCKKYTDIALKLYTENNDITGQSLCYNALGLLAMDTNDWASSLNYLNKQLTIGRKRRNKEAIIASMNNIAIVYYYQRDYKTAKKWFLKVYKMSLKVGFRLIYSTAVLNLGVIEYLLKNYEIAKDYFNQKLNISMELGVNRGILNARNNIAAVLFEQGKYHETIPIFKKNIELSTKLKLGNQVASNHHNLGQAYSITGDLDKSVIHMTKAIDIHKKENNDIKQAKILFDLAYVFSNKNNENKAESCYYKAMNLMVDKNDVVIYNKYKLYYCNSLYVNKKYKKFIKAFIEIKDEKFDDKIKVYKLINDIRYKLITENNDAGRILKKLESSVKELYLLQTKGIFYYHLAYLASEYGVSTKKYKEKSIGFFKKLLKDKSNYGSIKMIKDLESLN